MGFGVFQVLESEVGNAVNDVISAPPLPISKLEWVKCQIHFLQTLCIFQIIS